MLPAPGQPFRVLFCGINPGLYSAATGHHFARPGNRFWPALHAAGFTPRLLAPGEQRLLAEYGLGITNLVARATAQASELTREELQAGGVQLADLVARHRPRIAAVAGVTAYRAAFGQKRCPGRAAGRDDRRHPPVGRPQSERTERPLAAGRHHRGVRPAPRRRRRGSSPAPVHAYRDLEGQRLRFR